MSYTLRASTRRQSAPECILLQIGTVVVPPEMVWPFEGYLNTCEVVALEFPASQDGANNNIRGHIINRGPRRNFDKTRSYM
jgi:uncharacterized protein (DUF934 family)